MMQPKSQIDVLVLDGHTRAALAVVRSLGKAKLKVGVASDGSAPLAETSRYCSYRFHLPNPTKAKEEFGRELLALILSFAPKMLLPLTNPSLELCLALKDKMPDAVILPFPSLELIQSVNDKAALLSTASAFGFRTPKTLNLNGAYELGQEDREAIETFAYPAVLKARRSDTAIEDGFHREPVRYVSSAKESYEALARAKQNVGLILQEEIIGDGVGIFLLLKDGNLIAHFCHHRMLEKPPRGGVSVLSQSIVSNARPLAQATALLQHYNWNGVAMLEFKRSAEGEYYLIEINPRFWGSLQLAIDCGVNFPLLLFKAFVENDVTPSTLYTVGRRLRWMLGTLDHFIIALKADGVGTLRQVFTKNSLHWFGPRTKTEVFRIGDPIPFLQELLNYAKALFRREKSS